MRAIKAQVGLHHSLILSTPFWFARQIYQTKSISYLTKPIARLYLSRFLVSYQIVNFRHGAQIKNVRRAHDTLPASIPHLYFMLSLATIDSAYNRNDKKDIKS